jgi:hypothetical protein
MSAVGLSQHRVSTGVLKRLTCFVAMTLATCALLWTRAIACSDLHALHIVVYLPSLPVNVIHPVTDTNAPAHMLELQVKHII